MLASAYSEDIVPAAEHLLDEHHRKARFTALPKPLAPTTDDRAYATRRDESLGHAARTGRPARTAEQRAIAAGCARACLDELSATADVGVHPPPYAAQNQEIANALDLNPPAGPPVSADA